MKNCMLSDANLPQRYWAEAALTIVYILNRTLHGTIDEIPFTLLYGRKTNLSHLYTFGATAYVQIPRKQKRKGKPKAKKCKFLGYNSGA